MKIYELKADAKLPHHYFIAVGIRPIQDNNPGQLFLKYRPFYIHHSQIEKLRDAAILVQDKLFPTTQVEALKIFGVHELTRTFNSFRLAATVNLCSIFHFSSEYEINEEWFDTFVKSTNTSKSAKEKLFDAKIY